MLHMNVVEMQKILNLCLMDPGYGTHTVRSVGTE